MGLPAETVPRAPSVWFAEPVEPDERPARARESLEEFLTRSTWSRAGEIRAFYNDSLAALPGTAAAALRRRLGIGKGNEATFEMVVGRFLQLRGATDLAWEPELGGRQVDWRARFPDSTVHVEAMVPSYNR